MSRDKVSSGAHSETRTCRQKRALLSELEEVCAALALLLGVLKADELVGANVGLAERVGPGEVLVVAGGLAEEVDVVHKFASFGSGLLGEAPELKQLTRVVRGVTLGSDQAGIRLSKLVGGNATLADEMSGLQTAKGDLGGLVGFRLVTHEGTVARSEGEVFDASGLACLLHLELLEAMRVTETLEGGIDLAAGGGEHFELTNVDGLSIALEQADLSLFHDGLSKIVGVEDSWKN